MVYDPASLRGERTTNRKVITVHQETQVRRFPASQTGNHPNAHHEGSGEENRGGASRWKEPLTATQWVAGVSEST